MKTLLIRLKKGHKIDGDGEYLGKDQLGQGYTFWRSYGQMNVPIDLALRLEKEVPQRFEIVDKTVEIKQVIFPTVPKLVPIEQPKVQIPVEIIKSKPIELGFETVITEKTLENMTKDQINDWAAKQDYEVNPIKDRKQVIQSLKKQIEKKTGKKVK
jgi:hypothetical protein